MRLTLIDIIEDAILSDDEDREKNSERLKKDFKTKYTKEERIAIDDVFISVCGFSLSSLIEKHSLYRKT